MTEKSMDGHKIVRTGDKDAYYSFEITLRDVNLGGGYNLRLLINDEEVGGGVFPHTGDDKAAYLEAYEEGEGWLSGF